ncbi:hypothetical protein OAH77_04395 [Flavobacteriaceae bacterium]|nr:hypothetical protein [Flavobacteriaceae bacterium]
MPDGESGNKHPKNVFREVETITNISHSKTKNNTMIELSKHVITCDFHNEKLEKYIEEQITNAAVTPLKDPANGKYEIHIIQNHVLERFSYPNYTKFQSDWDQLIYAEKLCRKTENMLREIAIYMNPNDKSINDQFKNIDYINTLTYNSNLEKIGQVLAKLNADGFIFSFRDEKILISSRNANEIAEFNRKPSLTETCFIACYKAITLRHQTFLSEPKIVIQTKYGVINQVLTNISGLEVAVVEHDNRGIEQKELIKIKNRNEDVVREVVINMEKPTFQELDHLWKQIQPSPNRRQARILETKIDHYIVRPLDRGDDSEEMSFSAAYDYIIDNNLQLV